MKKILLILTISLSVLLLGACASSDSTDLERKVEVLEAQVIDLEAQVDEVEQILVDLEIIEGLNHQRDYTLSSENTDTAKSLFQSVSASEEYLVTGLDKSKLPSYLFDIDTGDPLEFSDVGNRLKLKYFGETGIGDYFKVGFQTKMRMAFTLEMSDEEFMARLVLMVEELENYAYWLIGGSELYLQITLNGIGFEIFIYMPSLLSDGFELSPSDYYYEKWEIEISNFEFDLDATQTYYDTFILDGLFDNFVLNFN